jgi:hypothetical protein
VRRLSLFLLLAAACAGSGPSPAGPTDTVEAGPAAAAEEAPAPAAPPLTPAGYLAQLEELSALATKNKGDCAALAAALTRAFEERRAALLAPDPALTKAISGDDALRPRMEAAMGALMEGGLACRDDPAYRALAPAIRPAAATAPAAAPPL